MIEAPAKLGKSSNPMASTEADFPTPGIARCGIRLPRASAVLRTVRGRASARSKP